MPLKYAHGMAKSKSSRDRDVARIERQLAKAAKATPAAPAYIDIDDPADLVIADFYNALTTGNAAMVQSISRATTHRVHGTPIEMKRVPVFDLGHLTDTRNPTDDAIKEADWYRLDRE